MKSLVAKKAEGQQEFRQVGSWAYVKNTSSQTLNGALRTGKNQLTCNKACSNMSRHSLYLQQQSAYAMLVITMACTLLLGIHADSNFLNEKMGAQDVGSSSRLLAGGCPAGQYLDTTCVLCADGTFKTGEGDDIALCVDCLMDSVSSVDRTTCECVASSAAFTGSSCRVAKGTNFHQHCTRHQTANPSNNII